MNIRDDLLDDTSDELSISSTVVGSLDDFLLFYYELFDKIESSRQTVSKFTEDYGEEDV